MAGKALYILAAYDDRTEERLSGIQNRLYELGFSGIQTKNIPCISQWAPMRRTGKRS